MILVSLCREFDFLSFGVTCGDLVQGEPNYGHFIFWGFSDHQEVKSFDLARKKNFEKFWSKKLAKSPRDGPAIARKGHKTCRTAALDIRRQKFGPKNLPWKKNKKKFSKGIFSGEKTLPKFYMGSLAMSDAWGAWGPGQHEKNFFSFFVQNGLKIVLTKFEHIWTTFENFDLPLARHL